MEGMVEYLRVFMILLGETPWLKSPRLETLRVTHLVGGSPGQPVHLVILNPFRWFQSTTGADLAWRQKITAHKVIQVGGLPQAGIPCTKQHTVGGMREGIEIFHWIPTDHLSTLYWICGETKDRSRNLTAITTTHMNIYSGYIAGMEEMDPSLLITTDRR